MLKYLAPAAALSAAALLFAQPGQAARLVPAPARDVANPGKPQVAVLAGGCFWGMEAVFEHVKGVRSVTSGYAGGTRQTANYQSVSSETTGHAEAVRIVYDPRVVSYGTLLRIYFSVAHDPTQLNRQTPDVGPSYRSAIFPQSTGQAEVAQAYIAQLDASRAWPTKIATKVEQGSFFPAEAFHQDFARRNPGYSYIVKWDRPKLAALRAEFPTLAR